MVDHNQNRIVAHRQWEVSDEIDRELSERERNSGWDGVQRGDDRMSVDLVLLANHTTHNEVFDKSGEAWPPEVTFKDSFGVKDTHVSREWGGMDGMKESRVG